MRYFLELAYQGKAYHGWQRQPNAISVQEVVENKLFTLFQEHKEIVGAGRTDAGVHAKQLFAHFDAREGLNEDLVFKLNSLLPNDIAVQALLPVLPGAHARFDAVSRSYEYHVIQEKDPFAHDSAHLVKRNLDVDSMNAAAKILLEYSNFKCFSRSRTDVFTYNCKIEYALWVQKKDRLVFHIKADRFLRNMVRAIVGTMLEIGLEKMEVKKMHDIIRSEDRGEAGASVPAKGLYLTQVDYPKTIFI
ncbi:tRNA pseudouridine(38-40) synthase TruA [Salinimicrobium sp. GXAS 041]|uniref:tRNA pseudouridine(38-40) synthase TruA n=1 Tax=Salinimicrobium sp. GXAS 041 TaxID=3400806 RepID=UPI003C78D1D1